MVRIDQVDVGVVVSKCIVTVIQQIASRAQSIEEPAHKH